MSQIDVSLRCNGGAAVQAESANLLINWMRGFPTISIFPRVTRGVAHLAPEEGCSDKGDDMRHAAEEARESLILLCEPGSWVAE